MRKQIITTIASIVVLTSAAAKAADTYSFDKSHTHILFYVSHFGFSTTQGEFLDFDGTLLLDPEDPANSTVSVTIDAASIDTGYAERDEHLRTADFFDVEQFPVISFESRDVEMTGDDTAIVTGDLTILGETREVQLDVKLNGMGPHPFREGVSVAGFDATATILRSDFGMSYGVPAVGDEVEIRITTEASPAS